MKIMDNGVVRDMTPEEEEEFIRWHENVPPPGSEENEAAADKLYHVVQAHTSQSDWTPDKTPALWSTRIN